VRVVVRASSSVRSYPGWRPGVEGERYLWGASLGSLIGWATAFLWGGADPFVWASCVVVGVGVGVGVAVAAGRLLGILSGRMAPWEPGQ
jgi:hypothetical protein